MYEISEELSASPDLPASAKLVFAVVASLSRDNPSQNLAYSTIAQKTNLTEMTVMRSIKHLVEKGWLDIAKNDRGWNYYGVRVR